MVLTDDDAIENEKPQHHLVSTLDIGKQIGHLDGR